MNAKTITVPSINCAHCVMTIERELAELEGVHRAAADLETKSVTVEWSEPATWEGVKSRLTEIGYAPAG
jgi:copper chaperone